MKTEWKTFIQSIADISLISPIHMHGQIHICENESDMIATYQHLPIFPLIHLQIYQCSIDISAFPTSGAVNIIKSIDNLLKGEEDICLHLKDIRLFP